MRFRTGSSVLYPVLFGLTLTVGVALVSGCGGGGSSDPRPTTTASGTPTPLPTATPTPSAPVTVRTRILWVPRSRQAVTNTIVSNNLTSALSATIALLPSTGQGNPIFTQTVTRDVPASGGPQDYDSPSQVTPGIYQVRVRFYSGTTPRDQDLVGEAAASVDVRTTGTTTTIATAGRIQSVQVLPNQTVTLGQTQSIAYSAFDGPVGTSNVIAVTPGSGFVTVTQAPSAVTGQASLTAQGENITGVNPSLNPYSTAATDQTLVTVRVDNAVSVPTAVRVASNVAISVNPASPTVSPLLPLELLATVANDGPAGFNGVTFTLQGDATAGSVVADANNPLRGVYTAPGLARQGTYNVVVRSKYDPNVSITVPINVSSSVTVDINPKNPTLSIRQQQKFTATTTSIPTGQDAGVTWAVVGGAANGTITSDGLYTAPAVVPANPVQIVATSKFDTSKTATTTVTVRSFVAIVITPNPVTLSIRETRKFTAAVTGVLNSINGVTWTAPDGGTIDANGNFTAPATPGNYRIVATSIFDPATSQTITVRVASGSAGVIIK